MEKVTEKKLFIGILLTLTLFSNLAFQSELSKDSNLAESASLPNQKSNRLLTV